MTRTPRRSSVANSIAARFPATLTAAELLACSPFVEEDEPEAIGFTPVPRQRKRRGGWSEEAQRQFIACLQRTASVSAAARAVGRSASTAYRLLDAEGAESFAIAWDKAFAEGLGRLRDDAVDRAMNGALVPVYRKGRLVRVEHRRSDRMAIALLGGRNRNIDWYRQGALRRHVATMEQKAMDEELSDRKRREEEAQRTYDEELRRMIEAAKAKGGPRVRML
jgi:hypothetical protein